MAEITVGDLLTWEPRLSLHSPPGFYGNGGHTSYALDREVTWAVTVRASAPVLPPIRGGEVVIVPARTVEDSGLSLTELLREIAVRGATGVIFDRMIDVPSELVPLVTTSIPGDLESDINRLLTEHRGEIYRSGTELGRVLQRANALGADVEHIVKSASAYLEMDVTVAGASGEITSSAARPASSGTKPPAGGRGWSGDLYGQRLAGGEALWLGPVPAARRALTRVVAERLAVGVEAALAHALEVRPRGSARAIALAGLMASGAADAARAASSLGLPANGAFRVALAAQTADRLQVQRDLAIFGATHDAADLDGYTATLVELRGRARGTEEGRRKRPAIAPQRERGHDAAAWVAISGPVASTGQIPEAARQARFMAALIGAGLIDSASMRFDRVSDVGVYRLLYPLWGSADLELFASDALGTLLTDDRRGILRETLLAYLEAGGSQVEAASRLGVHRNTLSYRLKQIAQLTGSEPIDPGHHLALHMALLASTLPPAP